MVTVGRSSTRRALIRRPGPRLADGIVTHLERRPVDVDRAGVQWHAYVEAMRQAGWSVLEVPPAPECPDAVFIEDAVVMFDALAVVTRPGAAARRPETVPAGAQVRALGYETHVIEPPGTLDGGDVLKVGRRAYVGRGGRTNAAGIAQLREIVEPQGWSVLAVPTTRVLHLKSAVTALPDGSIVGYPPLVDDPSFFPHFRAVPEPSGAHVLDLGGGRILMAASAPGTARLFSDLGYDPVLVDISELEKLEGGVTCLSVRLRAAPTAPR